MRQDPWKAAVRDAIEVPAHIRACAAACYYDLMHGPSWARIPGGDIANFTDDDFATFRDDVDDEAESGDLIQETYCGMVGDALRAFIDELPSDAWVDEGSFCDSEPEGWQDDATFQCDDCGHEWSGERDCCDCCPACDSADVTQTDDGWNEPFADDTYHLDHADIVAALFGQTIAREFR